ncbi:ATP-binding cassette domain-containing protein [Streptomyces sp. NPDC002004]
MDGPHKGDGRADGGPAADAGVAVRAEGLGLEGPRGWVFREVTFEAAPGSLIAVEGPSGSGRTCLLLALTGRMKPTEGHATVGRFRLPKQLGHVRRVSGLGPVPGVTDLDPALTVGEHLRERALLQRRFGGSLRELLRPRAVGARPGGAESGVRGRKAQTQQLVDTALAAAGLDVSTLVKGPRTAVRDLERLEALRLSVALALIGRPRLLGVDDTDLKLSDAERAEAWALLRSIADSGTTVLAVCSEAPEGALVVSTAARTTKSAPQDAGADRSDRDTGTTPKTLADKVGKATEADNDGAGSTTRGARTEDATEPGETDRLAEHGENTGHDEQAENDHGKNTENDKEGADALAEARRA